MSTKQHRSQGKFFIKNSKEWIWLFKAKKDQCDICVQHEVGSIDQEIWEAHITRKDIARAEKEEDKAKAIACYEDGYDGEKVLAIVVDMQAVLLCPSLQASSLYYKKKLCVHNYTIYDLATKDVTCYVWHEGEGGVSSNEFCSCLTDYLERRADKYDSFVIYSDGCCYQNRNVTLSNALYDFSKRTGKQVIQKILEKGHTQSEVDSVHATIERKLKAYSNKNLLPKRLCQGDTNSKNGKAIWGEVSWSFFFQGFFRNEALTVITAWKPKGWSCGHRFKECEVWSSNLLQNLFHWRLAWIASPNTKAQKTEPKSSPGQSWPALSM